jgi:hypothetical protein
MVNRESGSVKKDNGLSVVVSQVVQCGASPMSGPRHCLISHPFGFNQKVGDLVKQGL